MKAEKKAVLDLYSIWHWQESRLFLSHIAFGNLWIGYTIHGDNSTFFARADVSDVAFSHAQKAGTYFWFLRVDIQKTFDTYLFDKLDSLLIDRLIGIRWLWKLYTWHASWSTFAKIWGPYVWVHLAYTVETVRKGQYPNGICGPLGLRVCWRLFMVNK